MQGKDKSLHLKIMPAKELQARKFQLIVQVQCSYLFSPPESPQEFDKGISYLNVAYNETCEFVDNTTAYDLDFFVLIAIFGFMHQYIMRSWQVAHDGGEGGRVGAEHEESQAP